VRPRHIYVHVPFCARRCSYCDFSIAVRRTVPADEYVDALLKELDLRYPRCEPWPVDTLYLGGGTPSLLGPAVERLLDGIRSRLELVPDAELTLEANPEDVTSASVACWSRAGINRLSLGAQSFDDDVLRWMHRVHSTDQTRAAVAVARTGGIGNISLDLIFALPEEIRRDWKADLEAALALHPEHLSLYGLTLEPYTPLSRWRERGQVTEACEERYEREFIAAHDSLEQQGFTHYEVSSYAAPNRASRHNWAYWERAPYTGFGPSAHSFDGTIRRWNERAYTNWLRSLAAERDPAQGSEVISPEARADEEIYLGLRTSLGVPLSPPMAEAARPWIEAGWATNSNGALRLTAQGWLRLDTLAADLTTARSR